MANPPDDSDHYLKNELYGLVQSDATIFEFLQQGSLDGIWYWDLQDPAHEWMSPAFWTTFGVNPVDMKHLASEWQDLIHPEDLETALDNFHKHVADPNHPYDQIVRYRHCDGSTVWVRCRGLAIRDGEGNAVRMLGAHTDITELKRAEEALRQRTEELQKTNLELDSKKRELELVIEGADAGVWRFQPATGELAWDDSMYSLYGVDKHEFKSAYEAWLHCLHPSNRKQAIADWEALIAGGESYDATYDVVTKTGEARRMHAKAHLERDSDGHVVLITGINVDVTYQSNLEKTLMRSQKMEAIGNLAAGVAHDFNNLLAPILGYAELLEMKAAAKTEEQEYAGEIITSALRAKELVNQILSVSSNAASETEPTSLAGIVEEVVNVTLASAPKGIEIHTDMDSDVPLIAGDSAKLYQLTLNLCANAVQAMGREGRLTVTLRYPATPRDTAAGTGQDNKYVCLGVADTGTGIDEATLNQIFDPFFTTKNKGPQRGTGLGLFMVAGIVEAHGGSIHVDTNVGKGSLFEVFLPAADAQATTAPQMET